MRSKASQLKAASLLLPSVSCSSKGVLTRQPHSMAHYAADVSNLLTLVVRPRAQWAFLFFWQQMLPSCDDKYHMILQM